MISARTVFLVGGQGSQYFGMGKSLLANEQYASTWCSLNDYVKAARGIDVHAYVHAQGATIADACDNLPCTSAALLMLQLALADTLRSRGVVPDVLVGSSLGEFGAMVIAGYLSPFQVLDFVIDLAEIVQHGVPRGGMLAVLGSPRLVLGYGSIEVVARNHANHTIIAGTDSDLAWAEQVLNGDDVLTLRLPTPAPFHSSLLDQRFARCRRIGQRGNLGIAGASFRGGQFEGLVCGDRDTGRQRRAREHLARAACSDAPGRGRAGRTCGTAVCVRRPFARWIARGPAARRGGYASGAAGCHPVPQRTRPAHAGARQRA